MNLTILNMTVRQDAEGRYCLNDCHRASGGAKKDGPSYWLATEEAKKLTSHLDSETTVKPVVTVEGRNGGTYVAKELVYAYAMWISPAFHLTVIRAFDAMVTGAIANKPPVDPMAVLNDPAAMRGLLLNYADRVIALEAENHELAPKAASHDRLANSIGRTNLREVGKVLQIGSQRGIEMLREIKWTYRDQAGRWHAYADKIDAGLLEVKFHTFTNTNGEERSTQQVFVTPKGMTRLAARLEQN